MLELEDFPLSDTDVMRVMVGGVVFLTSAAPIRVGVGLITNFQTLGDSISARPESRVRSTDVGDRRAECSDPFVEFVVGDVEHG